MFTFKIGTSSKEGISDTLFTIKIIENYSNNY